MSYIIPIKEVKDLCGVEKDAIYQKGSKYYKYVIKSDYYDSHMFNFGDFYKDKEYKERVRIRTDLLIEYFKTMRGITYKSMSTTLNISLCKFINGVTTYNNALEIIKKLYKHDKELLIEFDDWYDFKYKDSFYLLAKSLFKGN